MDVNCIRLISAGVAICLLILVGCAVPHVPSRVIYEDPTNFVRLEEDSEVLAEWPPSHHTHPFFIEHIHRPVLANELNTAPTFGAAIYPDDAHRCQLLTGGSGQVGQSKPVRVGEKRLCLHLQRGQGPVETRAALGTPMFANTPNGLVYLAVNDGLREWGAL